MNLAFPRTTDALMAANRRIHPDAVLRKLRILAVLGVIRERNGTWEKLPPPPKDEEEVVPSVWNYGKCRICSAPVGRTDAKYCSRECSHKGGAHRQHLPRPNCRMCGKKVGTPKNIYCSKTCHSDGMRGRKS